MSDKNRHLPPNVYLQSYLQKAGVRFDVNRVDTVCRRGITSYMLLAAVILVFIALARALGLEELLPRRSYQLVLCAVCLAYLFFYLGRLQYYLHLRRRLRRDDDAPLSVEAYAIVLLDVSRVTGRTGKPHRSCVLFKEVGSEHPRFFTGAVKSGIRQHYHPDQIGQVFRDRRRPEVYTLDDTSAFQTVSARKRRRLRFSIAELNQNKVGDRGE